MATLERQLEEERQKSEDLQFRIDEATICGGNETVNITFHEPKLTDILCIFVKQTQLIVFVHLEKYYSY